jgi:hypothetical protein
MLWGVEDHVTERFVSAGIKKEIFYSPEIHLHFVLLILPQIGKSIQNVLRSYNECFEAAEKSGRASDLQHDLVALFNSQNKTTDGHTTSIPASFLKVTVVVRSFGRLSAYRIFMVRISGGTGANA